MSLTSVKIWQLSQVLIADVDITQRNVNIAPLPYFIRMAKMYGTLGVWWKH